MPCLQSCYTTTAALYLHRIAELADRPTSPPIFYIHNQQHDEIANKKRDILPLAAVQAERGVIDSMPRTHVHSYTAVVATYWQEYSCMHRRAS